MKNSNPIQFAVVREDPEIELNLVSRIPNNGNILLIGSGGCTALSIATCFPSVTQTLIEPNKSQIELIKRKLYALTNFSQTEIADMFSVGTHSPTSLISCGNFESLFKSFRLFLYEFVMESSDWLSFFLEESDYDFPGTLFASKYWPIAFELFFSDSLLIGMFGLEAVQHAAGSYPQYFQKLFEKGLQAKNARQNYFLHHVFLGHYLNSSKTLPPYLTKDPFALQSTIFKFENVFAQDFSSFSHYDLLSFSNIFDWMDENKVKIMAERVGKEMKSGAWLIYRQLNNNKNLRHLFGRTLRFDDALAQELHRQDRSLFYSSLHIAQKR